MYDFRVSAINAQGESVASLPVTFSTSATRPRAPPPPKLAAPPKTDRAVITLDYPKSFGGLPLKAFSVEITDGSKNPEEYKPAYKGIHCEIVQSRF